MTQQPEKPSAFSGKICGLILARNEEETVGEIVCAVKKYVDTIYVVDNRSTDSTAEIARNNGAQVITHNEEEGYGAAQYAGHTVAIDNGYDYILQLDADGQHDPVFIPKLLEAMQNYDYDIVLGSRFMDGKFGSNLSFVRRIGIRFFSKMISILGRTRITDVTSGYKIYKASSLKELHKPSGKHPALEQMMEMVKKGMKIGEVPVIMPARNTGKSHLNLLGFTLYPARGMWAIIKVLLFR